MSKVRIGYDNHLENLQSYVMTSGTEDASNLFANCIDNNIYDWFGVTSTAGAIIDVTFASNVSASYVGLYRGVGITKVTIYYRSPDDTSWIEAGHKFTTGTQPIYFDFSKASSSKWRFEFTATTTITIADLRLGEYLTSEQGVYIGYSSPYLSRRVDYKTNKSDSGLPVGRSIKSQGYRNTLNLEFMTDSWVRSDLLPFIKHAEQKPFYMVWNVSEYPDEVAYSVTDGNIAAPRHSHAGLQSVSIRMTGFVE